MTTVKLETVTVPTSHGYTLRLSDSTQVGQVARYFSDYETHITTSTLEVARPVRSDQQVRDIDIDAGDRLVIFTRPIQQAELPAPLRPGDKMLRFATGRYEIQTHSKRTLTVGKPDEQHHSVPDVDLRYFVAPDALGYISRQCLRLVFDDSERVWFASRTGQTRVVIDEYELGTEQIPLNASQTVRLYRASDDPRRAPPLTELEISVEDARMRGEPFEPGNTPVHVCVGMERTRQVLRASERLSLGQLVARLAGYNQTTVTEQTAVYVLRLVAPGTPLATLNLEAGAFLYAALKLHYAQNFLYLHDIYHHDRTFTLSAGNRDEEKRIGCRSRSNLADSTLDVDLYDALILGGHDPRMFQNIAHDQGRIVYRAAENTWWIRAEDGGIAPMFVNNRRVTGDSPVRLMSGDVLTIGPSVTHYYARLEVEIASKAD